MRTTKSIKSGDYISDGFVGRYQKLIRETVIPYQYSVLCDKAPDTEKSHVIQNFINAGKALRGEDTGDGFYGMVFQDSDAAKWIEAAAYTLKSYPDSELEKTVDELIAIIGGAQDSDGYLNTYYTIKDKDKRFTNLLEGHELYCSGHMIEAACAYYEATGKDTLLNIMLKNVECIYKLFIEEKHGGCPGHPEIELALMKMYRLTKNEHCFELAKHFIDVRGADRHYFENEAKNRSWTVWGNDASDTDYMQSSLPVREQSDAVGHAVRAVYLYTAMADIAAQTDDKALLAACRRLWDSITKRRMYITGGIGSTNIGEAFTTDYDLPPDTAYCETCASIGLMFFASQMLQNEINGEYADVMELAFYNTVLAGMQLDGKRFFYVNPLECDKGISGVSATHRHDLTVRPGWYACACCPPNAARLISSLGSYAYGEHENTCYCHLFAAGTASFENGIKIICETAYPYGFEIKYTVSGSGRLAVRIPAYSEKFSVLVNSSQLALTPEKGYIYLDVKDKDIVIITLDGSARFVYPSPKIPALTGMAAIMKGPLVYCFEDADNGGAVLPLMLDTSVMPVVEKYDDALLCGADTVSAHAYLTADLGGLYSTKKPDTAKVIARAVPYYCHANRGECDMRVWLPAR